MAFKSEYKVGHMVINLRILMEPKGFLRIIMMFVALLAFSTTAGFRSVNPDDNHVNCVGFNNTAYEAGLNFRYPMDSQDFFFSYLPFPPPNATENGCPRSMPFHPYNGRSGYFVAMGVLSMIYVIAAIFVYMLFLVPDLFIVKWLVIGDFIATILIGVLYLLADISWSSGVASLPRFVRRALRDVAENCLGCNPIIDENGIRVQTFAQLAISLVFGYLAAFLWFASIWFVYKDTVWHKDHTGPLAPLYHAAEKRRKEEGGEATPAVTRTEGEAQGPY